MALLALAVSIFAIVGTLPGFYASVVTRRQERRQRARLDLSYMHARRWRWSEGAGQTYGVEVLIVNPSDRPGAITEAALIITYRDPEEFAHVVRVPSAAPSRFHGISPLPLPVQLDSAGAERGWLLFDLADGLLRGIRVERYAVSLSDSRGLEVSVNPGRFDEGS